MARMYSGAKGKSGSKRPIKKVPSWAPFKEKEVEKLVVKYAKAGKDPSEIGMILRDAYGVNSIKALTGKTISAILKENELERKLPEDLMALIKGMINLEKHLGKNHLDETAYRGLKLTTSKANRLIKYYKRTGRLSLDWKLDTTRLKMYLE